MPSLCQRSVWKTGLWFTEPLPSTLVTIPERQYLHDLNFNLNSLEGSSAFCKDSVRSLVAFYNNGALPCNCHSAGATSPACSPLGGQCVCRPHVIGRQCSRCQTGYYGFPFCKCEYMLGLVQHLTRPFIINSLMVPHKYRSLSFLYRAWSLIGEAGWAILDLAWHSFRFKGEVTPFPQSTCSSRWSVPAHVLSGQVW